MVVVDSSVWVEVFRRPKAGGRPFDLERHVLMNRVVVCLPIIQEVLQGIRDEGPFQLTRRSLLALPMIESPLDIEVYEEAAQLFRTARRAGYTVRSGVDCLIACCAIRHGFEVLHRDRDFSLLARVSSLRARDIHGRQGSGSA